MISFTIIMQAYQMSMSNCEILTIKVKIINNINKLIRE